MSDINQPKEGGVLKGEESLLLNHNYDGIQELDHVLPRWWLGILYATIVFAAWYAGYYMSGMGPTPQQELAVALKQIGSLKPAVVSAGDAQKEALLAAFRDTQKLNHGKEVYLAKCMACHADKGQGVVGPNLTDDFWISGKGTLGDIFNVVTNGVPEKGMPAWGPVLKPDELIDVVAFIHTLHGTNPPNPKAPQGEQHEFED